MAFTRFNGTVEPFAKDATGTNRTVFGDVVQSDDINDNLNADFKRGWEIVGINDNPTKQDFNGLGYTVSSLVAYLYQQGIAEYNSAQRYMANSIVMASDGKLYRSLTGDETTPNLGTDPLVDTVNWKKLSEGDNTQRFKVADAVNADEALNKGQLLTEIKAVDGAGSGLDADTVDGVQGALLGVGGAGYSWVDETANRVIGTVYTNTTGRPILVVVVMKTAIQNQLQLAFINNIEISVFRKPDISSGTNFYITHTLLVTTGYTYNISGDGLHSWKELK